MRTRLLLGALVLLAFVLVPLPYTYEAPGPTYTARRLLQFAGDQPAWSERILVPTVRRQSATPALALGAWLRPEAVLRSAPARAQGDGSTAIAFQYARLVARRLSGRQPDASYSGPPELGPSASLMLALTMAMESRGTPPQLDGKIAGTGVLDPEGGVHPVEGLPAKLQAAEEAGAIVFFHPASQRLDPDLEVVAVPVSSAREAFEALVHPGRPRLEPPEAEIVPGMGR